MLEVRDLHASVEGREVLSGVDLAVKPGDVIVVTGPNGSGKSTLARAILGDERVEVTRGSIILEEEDITEAPPEERFKKGLFLAFQSPPEFEGIRIGEFLLKVSGRSGEEAVKELKEITKRLGLPPSILFRELHRGLSGGEKKRVELLQALFFKPRYAVLDEIDSGVDIESVKLVVENVLELSRSGTGIVYITHNPLALEELQEFPTYVMRGGKLLENGR